MKPVKHADGAPASATIVPLETRRLRLRAYTREDAADVARLAGDRRVADTTANIPHPYPQELAAQWIASHPESIEAGQLLPYAITSRGDGELLGAVGLVLNREAEVAELGYWIAVSQWGRGIATEAAAAVVAHGFRQLGLHRIHAHCLARNPASGRVLEKLGMVREGVLREHVKKWGVYEDIVLYGLLRTDGAGRG